MPATGQVQSNQSTSSKLPLRVASHVVELEISGIRPAEKYDKEIMCDIHDPKAGRLGRIAEDEEFDDFQDDFNNRFEAVTNSRGGDLRVARRGSLSGSQHIKAMQKENKLCPKCQEKKDMEDSKTEELSKPEVEAIIKTPDFQGFFDNSSRLIERALGQEFNLMDEFFAEEDENKDNERLERGSKLQKKFIFQDKTEMTRAVTSIDWSPAQPEILLT